MNEYLAIYIDGCLCKNSLRAVIVVWLDASQKIQDCIRVNRSARALRCKSLWAILRIVHCAI